MMTDTHVPAAAILAPTSHDAALAEVDAAIERGRHVGRTAAVAHVGLDNRELVHALDGPDAADALVAATLDRLGGVDGLLWSAWLGGDDLVIVVDSGACGIDEIRSDIERRLGDVVELGPGIRTAIRFGVGIVRDGDDALPSTRIPDRHLLDDARADLTANRRERNRIVLDIGDVLVDTTPEPAAGRRIDLRIPSLSDALVDQRQGDRDDRTALRSVRR